MTTLEPLVRESTPELIARSLRQAISAGEFPPSTQLGEAALARQLGVSRGPLREAIARLTQEGLLVAPRNRGAKVPDLTREAVSDIYLLRSTIERAAIERVLEQGRGPETADRLDAAVAEMAALSGSPDSPEMVAADLAFHHELVEAADSERLSRVHQTVIVETGMCLRAMQATYTPDQDRVTEHRDLTAAIRAGDLPRAVAVLAEHMRDGEDRLNPPLSAPE